MRAVVIFLCQLLAFSAVADEAKVTGTVGAIDRTARTLTLEGVPNGTFQVPDKFDLSGFEAGNRVTITFERSDFLPLAVEIFKNPPAPGDPLPKDEGDTVLPGPKLEK